MTYTNSLLEHFAWSYSMSEDVSAPELRAEFNMKPRKEKRNAARKARRDRLEENAFERLAFVLSAAPDPN